MDAKLADVQTGWVTTEGDDLFYEIRGKGQPLLMIAPGGGDGWQYAGVTDLLAGDYRVIPCVSTWALAHKAWYARTTTPSWPRDWAATW